MGKRVLVIGSGVGMAAALRIAQHPGIDGVTVADIDSDRATRALIALGTDTPGTENIYPVAMPNNGGLSDLIKKHAVVLSAAPAAHNPRIAAAAYAARRPYCDLGGVMASYRAIEKLDPQLKDARLPFVAECGIAPGTGPTKCVEFADKLGGADEITLYVGGIPQKPEPPLYYQRVFSLEGLKHLMDPAPVVRDGEIVEVYPMISNGDEILRVDALAQFAFNGTVEAFITAGAGLTPWVLRDRGVKNFCEKTIRWPGFIEFARSTHQTEFVQKIGKLIPNTDQQHPDLLWMRIVAHKGQRVLSWELLDHYDPDTGLSAMARTTGFSAAVVAIMLAEGRIDEPGLTTQEQALAAPHRSAYFWNLLGENINVCQTA